MIIFAVLSLGPASSEVPVVPYDIAQLSMRLIIISQIAQLSMVDDDDDDDDDDALMMR